MMRWLRLCYLCLLVLAYVCFLVNCSSSPPVLCNPKQSFALLQFKNSTFFCPVSPTNCAIYKPEFWREGTDCCLWDGVTCDGVGNVIDLDLGCSYLCGTIITNSSLFQLSHLQRLNLAYNNLTGSIPEPIGNLTRLENLILSSNSFTGQLPSSLFKIQQLTQLDVSENILTGSIPVSIENLIRLVLLKLNANNFTGQIPTSISRLENLTCLDLSQNSLAGQFPDILDNFSKLIYLDLSGNNFNGPIDQLKPPNSLQEVHLVNNKIYGAIPSSIFELVNLTVLDLSRNNLSGIIAFDTLSKLKNLQCLNLSFNSQLSLSFNSNIDYALPNLTTLAFSSCNIVSEFPICLRTLENLKFLDLSNNSISGRISKFDSKGWSSLISLNLSNNFMKSLEKHPWENIVTLDLQNNMLQGSLVVPPPTTEVFLVSNNNLTGEISLSFCNLSSLRWLDLSKNHLSGKIPQCLGNSSHSLTVLHLQMNNLEGSIPDTFQIELCPLISFDLNHNNFEGALPRSLANCDFLQFLNVGNNNLSDIFPYWLGTLTDLRVLSLRSNRFYGHIREFEAAVDCKLRILDLSHNQFTGILPEILFKKLKLNMIMDLDDMYGTFQYIGEYSHQYDSLSLTMKGQEIEMDRIRFIFTLIDMSNNHFQGEIPTAVGNIKSLIVLNLANNNLTGKIPMSLGKLTELESLDLSSNKLEGRIPTPLESLTFLEALNLSHNKLSGPIPQGGQLSTFENDSFIGNIGLCGKPLSVKCGKPPQIPPASHEEQDSANRFDWKITMMGYGCGLVIGLSLGYVVFSKGEPLWFARMFEAIRRKMVRRHGRRHRR